VYRRVLYPLLARIDPEAAHQAALWALAAMQALPPLLHLVASRSRVVDDRLGVRALGLSWPNPVGLAAGFDKDARVVRALAALGFGGIEVGTVTPRPQPGNPHPRLFRLPEDAALINRLGFPSRGVEVVRRQLLAVRTRASRGSKSRWETSGGAESVSASFDGEGGATGSLTLPPIGVNVGKNRDTPLERAVEDYLTCVEALHGLADYLVVNVSSPNTPGLRQLQARSWLDDVLPPIVRSVRALDAASGRRCPVLLKIAPDLSFAELDEVLAAATAAGIDGLVATNTTVERPALASRFRGEAGGLSGAPLRARSTEVIRFLHRSTAGRLPIVGVGGVATADDVLEKMEAGAALVQVYTAFVYRGPGLVADICRGLLDRMAARGVRDLAELVGSAA